eukprot:6912469-Alexandrium_andersonii.AAC.1
MPGTLPSVEGHCCGGAGRGAQLPGPDGLPCEVCQAGGSFVAALSAQAQYAHSGIWGRLRPAG